MDKILECNHEYKAAVSPMAGKSVRRSGPPKYFYQCKLCNKTKWSIVNIKACQHEFVNDPDFGEAFNHIFACNKCGKQRVYDKK